MRPTPDFRCLHRAARGISPQGLARVALDPSPTCLGTIGRTCLSRSGMLAADGSERQPLLVPKSTQPEHGRHSHHRAAAPLGTPHVVKALFASSYSHPATLD